MEIPSVEQILSRADLGRCKHYQLLAQGASNFNYLLKFESFNAVLKIAKQEPSKLKTSVEFLHLASKSPYLPELLWYDENHYHSLIERFIEGEHLYHLDVKQAQQLAEALNALHSVSPNPERQTMVGDSNLWEHYYQTRLLTQYEIAREKAPPPLLQKVSRQLDQIERYGANHFNRYLSITKPAQVFVHTDLIPLNILFTSKQCVIIDLELIRQDFLEWDICSVLKAFRFTPESLAAFHATYNRPIDNTILQFVSILQYCNVALWRMCAFYARNEIQGDAKSREFFLSELAQELDWVEQNISLVECIKPS